uniref:Rho guanine nucleotide exchange factor 17 n=1 Tax=Anas platyrhynchos platyrhynchos TaxID=8840 RepID=U3IID1_ANAPP
MVLGCWGWCPGLSEPVDSAHRELVPFDSDDTDDESSPSPSGTLQSQASHSTISSSFGNEEIPSCKEAAAETTSSEEEQEPGFLPLATTFGQSRHGESPTDGRALRRSSRGSFTRGSLEDLLSLDPEAYQSSMWLGTEDGCIHVYQSSDNIRNRKNSMKMQHAASVMCILYLDNQVFVSLANGELIAYQREAGRFWDPQNSKSLSLGSPGSPITKMVAVAGKLWCGCQNRVIVLNTATLVQEHTLHVGQDSGRSVTCMVSAGPGVWVALQGSAQVRLYHATSYEQLAEADVTPPVHKMLAATTKSHATIAQHLGGCKMSCRNRVGAVKYHAEIAVAVKHDAEIEWVRRNAMQKSCSSCKMPCRNQAVAAKCCTEIKQQLQNAMRKPGRWLHNPMQQ